MDSIARGFLGCTSAFGQLLFAKAAVDSRHGCRISACFSRVLGAFFLFGGPAVCIASNISWIGSKGETYNGHFFPYTRYPHGHLDCKNGSTIFNQTLSEENERVRNEAFMSSDVCKKGIEMLTKPTIDFTSLLCLPGGVLFDMTMKTFPVENFEDMYLRAIGYDDVCLAQSIEIELPKEKIPR